MKARLRLHLLKVGMLAVITGHSQPVANFSISPNPVCVGSTVQITDLSTGAPTAWSYTISNPPATLTTQNPTMTVVGLGVKNVTLVASNSGGTSAPVVKSFTVLNGPATAISPSLSITCPGKAPVTLTVNNPGNATYTYSWSTGATSYSISVSPNVTTAYSVIVTNTAGCSSVLSSTVFSNPPNVTIIPFPFTICQNGMSTLTATGSGNAPFTYSWSSGATTSTVSTNLPGVYTVTVTNGNGCFGTHSLNLQSSTTLSLALAATTLVCTGQQAGLSVKGAASYTWSHGPSIPNVFVNPTVTTTYSVVGTAGTCTGSALATVSVNAVPSLVSSTIQLCSGSSTVLSGQGAESYTWSTGSTTNSTMVSPSVTSVYTLVAANPACPKDTAFFTVHVNQLPTLQITSSKSVACVGDNIVLSVTGAASYTWNNSLTGSSLQFIAQSANQIFSVTAVDDQNCQNKASYTQSVIVCQGLTTYSKQRLVQVYPSVGAEISIIGLTNCQLSIYNTSGALVRKWFSASGQVTKLTELSPGFYYLISESSTVKGALPIVIIE